MWQALDLKAALSLSPSLKKGSSQLPDLTMELNLLDKKASRATLYLEEMNLKPPSGVQIVYLDSIDITFTMSALALWHRPGNSSNSQLSFESLEPVSMLQNDITGRISLFQDELSNEARVRYQPFPYSADSTYDGPLSQHPDKTAPESESSWQESLFFPSHSQDTLSSCSDMSNCNLFASGKNHQNGQGISLSSHPALDDCSVMVDAALRKTLSGSDLHLPKGINAHSSSNQRSLASIAPAIFHPQYRMVSNGISCQETSCKIQRLIKLGRRCRKELA